MQALIGMPLDFVAVGFAPEAREVSEAIACCSDRTSVSLSSQTVRPSTAQIRPEKLEEAGRGAALPNRPLLLNQIAEQIHNKGANHRCPTG